MRVVRGPTYWCVMSFVGLFFVAPLLTLIPRTSAALQMIGDPNHDVSRFRRELRNQWEVTVVVHAL